MALLAAALTLAAPAAALGWGETATHEVPHNGPADCLRAAGGGLISLLGSRDAKGMAAEIFSGALQPLGEGPYGRQLNCPGVAANDSGVTVLAAPEYDGKRGDRIRAATFEPGRPRAVITLAAARYGIAAGPVVAVGPAGDAAVAWVADTALPRADFTEHLAVFVARRPPGGSFSAPQRIDHWTGGPDSTTALDVAVGVDAAGTTTAAWARATPPRHHETDLASVRTAIGARDAPVGSAQATEATTQDLDHMELSVTPSGDALLAVSSFDGLELLERRAVGRFTTVKVPGANDLELGVSEPALAEAADGSAVLAWRIGDDQPSTGGVKAVRRAGHGAFGRPVELAPPRALSFGVSDYITISGATPPEDEQGPEVHAAISASGRPIVTWVGVRSAGAERRIPTTYVARGAATGGFERRARLGSPCRPAIATAPLVLRGGSLAAAWTDGVVDADLADLPRSAGRLHLALPGAPPRAQPPAPHVTVTAPRHPVLRFDKPLRLRVRCDRACDLRAFVPDGTHAPPRAVGMASLRGRGTTRVAVEPGFDENVARANGRPVPIVVHACPRGGERFTATSLRVAARRHTVPPLAPPIGVTATRRGHRIIVRWRSARPARGTSYEVYGLDRGRHAVPAVTAGYRHGRGRKRFRVTLVERAHARPQFVTVIATQDEPPHHYKQVVVRIR